MTWEIQEQGREKKQRTQQNRPEETSTVSTCFMRERGFLFLPPVLHFLIHLPSEEHVYSALYYKAYGSGSNERQDKIPLHFSFFARSTVVRDRLEQNLLGEEKRSSFPATELTQALQTAARQCWSAFSVGRLISGECKDSCKRGSTHSRHLLPSVKTENPSWKTGSDIAVNKQKPKPKK